MPFQSKRFNSANSSQLEKASQNNPALRFGSEGDGVIALQDGLMHLGYDMPITTADGQKSADGIYGSETAGQVKGFQRDQGLMADGIAGHDTLTLMDQLFAQEEAQARQFLFADAQMFFTTSGNKGGI